jgi:hypothetical protein
LTIRAIGEGGGDEGEGGRRLPGRSPAPDTAPAAALAAPPLRSPAPGGLHARRRAVQSNAIALSITAGYVPLPQAKAEGGSARDVSTSRGRHAAALAHHAAALARRAPTTGAQPSPPAPLRRHFCFHSQTSSNVCLRSSRHAAEPLPPQGGWAACLVSAAARARRGRPPGGARDAAAPLEARATLAPCCAPRRWSAPRLARRSAS